MCQACYNKGFKDYPTFNKTVAHIEDYKRGYKTKQYESMGDEEQQHTFFCESCFERGISNCKNGLWAPPFSTKRGHYESYEKGYNQGGGVLDTPEAAQVTKKEQVTPPLTVNAPQSHKFGWKEIVPLIAVAFIGLFIYFKFGGQSSNHPLPLLDTVTKTAQMQDTTKPLPTKDAKVANEQPKVEAVATTSPAPVAQPIPEPQKPVEKPTSAYSGNPQTSQKLLTEADLKGLDKAKLRFMRNEIFARHGYIFKSQELNNYFKQQPWYKPTEGDVSAKLSETERLNIALIKKLEH